MVKGGFGSLLFIAVPLPTPAHRSTPSVAAIPLPNTPARLPPTAHAGEILPSAKIPAGVRFQPGDESVDAGKAAFYTLRYGRYLIAMNTTKDRTFPQTPPVGVASAQELVSGRKLTLAAPIEVGPRRTVILRLP